MTPQLNAVITKHIINNNSLRNLKTKRMPRANKRTIVDFTYTDAERTFELIPANQRRINKRKRVNALQHSFRIAMAP